MKLIRVLSALGVFICFVLWVSSALASRNSSGTMSGINGPYVAGTVISSSVLNARFADIESEITDSASRSGKGGFTAPVRGADGTSTAPTYSFTSETTAGLWRGGSGDVRMTFNSTESCRWTSLGIRCANGAVATPSLSFFDDTGSGLYRIGSNNIGFAINGVKVQEWDANTTTTKIGSKLALWGSTPTLGFNLYNDGSNKYMTTNIAGGLTLDLTNGFIFYTAPSGSADAVATLTERVRVNTSGLTIGSGGTAISKSVSGTASFATGNMNANTCVAVTVTTTGSTSGSPCAVGNSADPGDGRFVISCRTHTADQCSVDVCNVGAITLDPADFTVRCTVFNP